MGVWEKSEHELQARVVWVQIWSFEIRINVKSHANQSGLPMRPMAASTGSKSRASVLNGRVVCRESLIAEMAKSSAASADIRAPPSRRGSAERSPLCERYGDTTLRVNGKT